MRRASVLLLAVGVWWLVQPLRCREDGCALAPAHWNADLLDDETFQQITFSTDGTGEMSYSFNHIVHTNVRFRYQVSGSSVDLTYTRGTREKQRRVRWKSRVRDPGCELLFEETPFPSDVESLEVESYSRRR